MQALFVALFIVLVYKLVFCYKHKRSEKIYSEVIAHRGLHLFAPENSLAAYSAAKAAHMAIELDVRQTKDKELVCFHDRYTKRLLNIPGKLSMFDLETIKRYRILGSDEYVPTLIEAMELMGKDTTVLIEVKGRLNDDYLYSLREIVLSYGEKLYFHTENIYSYFKLKKHIGINYPNEKRIFLILDVFGRMFWFLQNL